MYDQMSTTRRTPEVSYEDDDDDNGSSSFEPTEIDIPRFLQNKNF